MPMYSLPMNFFSCQTPKASHRVPWTSAMSSKGKFCLALNFSCLLISSFETPYIRVLASMKAWCWSLKSCPSVVQPGVASFG